MEEAKAMQQQQQLIQEQHRQQQQQQHFLLLQQLQKQQQSSAISRFPSNIDAHLRPIRPLNLQQNPNPNPNPNPILNLHHNPNSNHLPQQQHQKIIRPPGNQIELQMAYQDAWRVCHPDFKRPFSSLEDACDRFFLSSLFSAVIRGKC